MIRAYRPFTTTVRAQSLLMAALAMFFASTAVLAQTMASSVSQHGITWYFDQEYEVGRYANGDWWVLGPVTITRITPESEEVDGRWLNGTMLNPLGAGQAYDSSANAFSLSDNVAPSAAGPLSLSTGSLVSAISLSEPSNGKLPAVEVFGVLTVVSEVPPERAFRPYPYGNDKTSYWTESDVDYSILQSLPVAGQPPSMSGALYRMESLWNEQATNSPFGQRVRSTKAGGWNAYGRDTAKRLGDYLLMLHLDYSIEEKRDLYVHIIQYGLDIFQLTEDGATWDGNGGHNHGRKAPMLLAGLALNDANILFWADRENTRDRCRYAGSCYGFNQFQEDGSTFYVSQGDIDTSSYTQDFLGVADWSARYWQHYNEAGGYSSHLDGESGGCSGGYRFVGAQYMAHGLAMRLTSGAVAAWNWPAFFDYIDRFATLGCAPDGDTNGVTHFARVMWDSYRDLPVSSDTPSQAAVPPASPTVVVD